jgi:hypothetical protein
VPYSTAMIPGNVTFNEPGKYITSLTELDSGGNSDPSPPTRTITVLPRSPDFEVRVDPPAVQVIPGQRASFTVTVTPLSGFNQTVNLSVSNFSGLPDGVSSSGFNPPSIFGSGSSTITIDTTTATTPYATSLTVTGSSGTISHLASTTLLVKLAAPAELNAIPGNKTIALSWASPVGATGYKVERSTISGGPYVTVGCPSSNVFTDARVANGKPYYYVVSALYLGGPNGGGESAPSEETRAVARRQR